MICLQNPSLDPYFNLALEEYLFYKPDDACYFWLWQNDNTIVIGKNQNAHAEVNRAYAQAHGIKVARRMTGGGAVYHDLGNINFTFVMKNEGPRTVDFGRFTVPIAKALAQFGVKAEPSGRNDLLIDGRKFSGNAQFVGRDKVIHHGTLMFSSDLSVVERCLTPDEGKLQSHGVSSTKSRVTTILSHMPKKIELAVFWDRLLGHILEAYGGAPARPLTREEQAAVRRLRDEKYATPAWIYGQSPVFNFSKAERFEGCGLVSVCLRVSNGRIEGCKISGDFFGAGEVSEIEEAVAGICHEEEAVRNALKSVDLAAIIHNLPKDGLLRLLV